MAPLSNTRFELNRDFQGFEYVDAVNGYHDKENE